MQYFGQCQILKREQKKQVKMQGAILKTCQEAEPIKQNSAGVLSHDLILCYDISTVNRLRLQRCSWSKPFFLHTYALKSVSPPQEVKHFLCDAPYGTYTQCSLISTYSIVMWNIMQPLPCHSGEA